VVFIGRWPIWWGFFKRSLKQLSKADSTYDILFITFSVVWAFLIDRITGLNSEKTYVCKKKNVEDNLVTNFPTGQVIFTSISVQVPMRLILQRCSLI
jgi:hypothetical protein